MYVEKTEGKEGVTYYLSHSFREGSKIHKIRKLLGKNLDSKTLKEREKKAEELILEEINKHKIISDPLSKILSKEELELVKKLQKDSEVKILHLSEKQWNVFSKVFTYNTNAIEGSVIDKKEVGEILEENKWPNKPARDIAETYGVKNAVDYIRKTKDHLSIDLIKELHYIVFKSSKSFAGQFRGKGEEVVVQDNLGNIIDEGAPSERVISLLNELVDWYKKYKGIYPPIVLAAVAHNQFENIHPFADGNGRVGRLLLNNVLIKHGLSPLNIHFKNRMRYYESIRAYTKGHDIKPMIELMLKEYKLLEKDIS